MVHYFYFYALWAVLQIVFKVGLGTGDFASVGSQMLQAIVRALWRVVVHLHAGGLLADHASSLFTATVSIGSALAVGGCAADRADAERGIALVDHFSGVLRLLLRRLCLRAGGVPDRRFGAGQRAFRSRRRRWSATLSSRAIWSSPAAPNCIRAASRTGLCRPARAAPGARLHRLGGRLPHGSAADQPLPWTGWLRWLGEHSIVVYLSFSIPMAGEPHAAAQDRGDRPMSAPSASSS